MSSKDRDYWVCSDRLFRTPGMLSHNMALPSPPPGPSYNAILLPLYLFVQLLPSSSWFFPESFLSFQHGNPFPSGMPSPGNSPRIDLQRCLLCLNRATWSQPLESPASVSAGWKVPISGHPTTLSSSLSSAHLVEIIICSLTTLSLQTQTRAYAVIHAQNVPLPAPPQRLTQCRAWGRSSRIYTYREGDTWDNLRKSCSAGT